MTAADLKKRNKIFLILISIGVAGSFLFSYLSTRVDAVWFVSSLFFSSSAEGRYHPTHPYLLNGKRIELEVVTSTEDMAQGLGDRSHLDPDHGMLFKYEVPAVLPFWMRHMHFPLDIIWIEGKEVIDIGAHLPPPTHLFEAPYTFTPRGPASWVLEVPAGQAEEYGLHIHGNAELVPVP